jgi:hypothetical protein
MDFKKVISILCLLVLVGCAAIPQEGDFTAKCHYVQVANGQVNLACVQITTTASSGGTPTPSPSARVSPSPIATTTSMPLPSSTPVPAGLNLFSNPGFEGNATIFTWPGGLRLAEVAIVQSWKPAFADFPYTAGPALALFQGTKNPNGLRMGRPEMRETKISNRIHAGSGAQYWFCQFRACDAGVYQTVQTQPGSVCTVSVWVQSWSRVEFEDGIPAEVNFKSQFPNDDAYSNSLWRIVVNPLGGANMFASDDVHSPWYGLPKTITLINGEQIANADHYDKYVQLQYTFISKGVQATIFFENLRLFPFRYNDSMVDDAAVICSTGPLGN